MNQTLQDRLAALASVTVAADTEFYAISLTADSEGNVRLGIDTAWVGWHGDGCRVELRQARVVDAQFSEAWRRAGLNSIFVLNYDDLLVFLVAGGNALVTCEIAKQAFPDIDEPKPSYAFGRSGFVGSGLLHPAAMRRAPTPKLRMEVLARDSRRCRICGRRPDDHVDVELHVHHIRPWINGGVTDPSNLVTLCHTCHAGLQPHFDPALFEYVDQRDSLTHIKEFNARVENYRRTGMAKST